MPKAVPFIPKPADAPKRLTLSLSRAAVVRDPKTGTKVPRGIAPFKKWESLADAR